MKSEPPSGRRSDCPLSIALELFGDRWTLLILRDLLLKGFTTFKQFQQSGEGIATNILTDRLKRLQNAGLIVRRPDAQFRHCQIDAAPLREVAEWAERYREIWEGRLDRLDSYLKTIKAKSHREKTHARKPRRRK